MAAWQPFGAFVFVSVRAKPASHKSQVPEATLANTHQKIEILQSGFENNETLEPLIYHNHGTGNGTLQGASLETARDYRHQGASTSRNSCFNHRLFTIPAHRPIATEEPRPRQPLSTAGASVICQY